MQAIKNVIGSRRLLMPAVGAVSVGAFWWMRRSPPPPTVRDLPEGVRAIIFARLPYHIIRQLLEECPELRPELMAMHRVPEGAVAIWPHGGAIERLEEPFTEVQLARHYWYQARGRSCQVELDPEHNLLIEDPHIFDEALDKVDFRTSPDRLWLQLRHVGLGERDVAQWIEASHLIAPRQAELPRIQGQICRNFSIWSCRSLNGLCDELRKSGQLGQSEPLFMLLRLGLVRLCPGGRQLSDIDEEKLVREADRRDRQISALAYHFYDDVFASLPVRPGWYLAEVAAAPGRSEARVLGARGAVWALPGALIAQHNSSGQIERFVPLEQLGWTSQQFAGIRQ